MYTFGLNDDPLKIDKAHADLIYGLVVANKPRSILELGLGGGEATKAILRAIAYNANCPDYVLVDNWMDFGGRAPAGVLQFLKDTPIRLVTANERDFVIETPLKYDFIMSDADHGHTQEWFSYVYDSLLYTGGILIYHDINLVEEVGVQLREIYQTANQRGLRCHLFNQNSLPDERCQRGLFVIFK